MMQIGLAPEPADCYGVPSLVSGETDVQRLNTTEGSFRRQS